EPEHDDDGVRLLGGEDAPGRRGPVGWIALGLIFDQTGNGLVLADHAHVRLFGIRVLETIGEPVRHAIAEHQHVALRHGLALPGRRRLGIILDPLRRLLLLLEWREQIAAEPAAAESTTAAARLLLLLLRLRRRP